MYPTHEHAIDTIDSNHTKTVKDLDSSEDKDENEKQGGCRNQNGCHKTLTELLHLRHSTRSFSDRAVPRAMLEEAFALAQLAPSSLNVQPWQLIVVSGARLERIKAVMHQAFDEKVPMTLPPGVNVDVFARHRSSFEDQLYFSPDGFSVPREDNVLYTRAFTQNLDFYGARTAVIVAIDKALGPLDVVSVGIYLQTLVFLLTEKGLQTCFQGTVTAWPDLMCKDLDLGDDRQLLCSLAIGYETREEHINRLKTPRGDWSENVRFVHE